MKKWFYLLMLAAVVPFVGGLTSCSSDDDLPNVDISLNVSKGVVDNGTIYVVQGDTIEVASVSVVNNEANKGAGVTNVNYYWDGLFYAPAVFAPYSMVFPTSEETPLGNHTIDMTCTVLAVDKSLATAALTYPVKVVASESELPQAAQPQNIVNSASLK